jgi:RNA polymerase sigma-70 factor (ECF subfamily)
VQDVDKVYESDRALVARMNAGDQRAFDEFFHSNAPRLAAFATRRSGWDPANVEDIVQNTLVKAIRNLASYRGEAALFTWLSEICRHEIADVYRKTARRPIHETLDDPSTLVHESEQLRVLPQHEPAAQADAQLLRGAVMRTLTALPERYALALEAKYGDGLSVEQIAGQLGVTPIAAQSLLARARDAFREYWRRTEERDTAVDKCYD